MGASSGYYLAGYCFRYRGFISVTGERISKLKANVNSLLKGDSLYVNVRSMATGNCHRPDHIINALCRWRC